MKGDIKRKRVLLARIQSLKISGQSCVVLKFYSGENILNLMGVINFNFRS